MKKMEGTHIRKLIGVVSLLFLLVGCSANGIQIDNKSNEDASALEKMMTQDERIIAATAILYEKELLMGIRVDTFSRFRKRKIEKEYKKQLEKLYPDFDITVSADNKILLEATKLVEQHNEKELSKKIKKLKSLLKEGT